MRLIELGSKPDDAEDFDDWLEPQRKAWGVSGEVIIRRLRDEGLIRHDEYDAYRSYRARLKMPELDQSGNRAFRHREPKHIFGDGFVRVVLDSLNARNISLAKASTYLDGIKIKDIDSLKGFYVGI